MNEQLFSLVGGSEEFRATSRRNRYVNRGATVCEQSDLIVGNKDTIPLFSIGLKEKNRNSYYYEGMDNYGRQIQYNTAIPKEALQMERELIPESITTAIESAGMRFILDMFKNRRQITLPLSALTIEQQCKLFLFYVQKEKKNLEEWISSPTLEIESAYCNVPSNWGDIYRWNSLLDQFFSFNGFKVFRSKASPCYYVVGPYYLGTYDRVTGASTPLVCLVTNRKYIEYLKLSNLTDDLINSNIVELWVKDDFDITGSIHKGLRSRYRKYIKSYFDTQKVEIVEKKDLTELFLQFTMPKFSSISEYEGFLTEESTKILKQLKINN